MITRVLEIPTAGRFARFTHRAMACEFEITIAGEDSTYAAQAARTAFEEVDRLESELSRFRPESEVSQVNANAGVAPVRVGIALLECIQLAHKLWTRSHGAFDITLGRFLDRRPDYPGDRVNPNGPAVSGMEFLEYDPEQFLVALTEPNVELDLGAIGKGYAVDTIAASLADWKIRSAIISSGQSTIRATGAPPGLTGWPITLFKPTMAANLAGQLGKSHLINRTISCSGIEQKGKHVLDPRTGRPPARIKNATYAFGNSGAETDGLSTAAMVMTVSEIAAMVRGTDEQIILLMPSGLVHRFGTTTSGEA